MCVLFSPLPPVFIGGSHSQQGCLLQLFLQEPPWGANDKLPCRRFEVVGSTRPAADQGGRPATQWRQPPPTFLCWACLGLLLSEQWGRACLKWICYGSWATLVHLSLNLCSDIFYDFMTGQSVLATYILAQKHNLHF